MYIHMACIYCIYTYEYMYAYIYIDLTKEKT